MSEQLSAHIGQTLLPLYAFTLLNISDKKDYEIIDAVCFICDCLEHGSLPLFGQIQNQSADKFIEMIEYAYGMEEPNYDILQSAVFGLGLIAHRQPNGQFIQLP